MREQPGDADANRMHHPVAVTSGGPSHDPFAELGVDEALGVDEDETAVGATARPAPEEAAQVGVRVGPAYVETRVGG